MAVASSSDVETELGRPIPAGTAQAQVEWWLAKVELLIVARLGLVALLDSEAVKHVEAEVVANKVRRADGGATSVTVQVDDGSTTRRYDNSVSPDEITDAMWSLLAPWTGATAYTLKLG